MLNHQMFFLITGKWSVLIASFVIKHGWEIHIQHFSGLNGKTVGFIWWVVEPPTLLKNHGVSSSGLGWWHSQLFLEKSMKNPWKSMNNHYNPLIPTVSGKWFKIPWFQSPPTSHVQHVRVPDSNNYDPPPSKELLCMFKFNISPVGAARVTDSTLGGFNHKITLPGKHTKNYGTSPSLIGKSTINGQFSIATLENHRVTSREKKRRTQRTYQANTFFSCRCSLTASKFNKESDNRKTTPNHLCNDGFTRQQWITKHHPNWQRCKVGKPQHWCLLV